MPTLFISDLHLQESRPDLTDIFLRFLAGPARDAAALYILGDLFESWVGDDDDAALADVVRSGLRQLTDHGVPVSFLHGNRDFLVGATFAAQTGVTLLPESLVIELHGEHVLLLHGDTLCSDDTAYLAFRAQVRQPAWQAAFLAQPLAARHAFAENARTQSRAHTASMHAQIMDVTEAAVIAAFREHGVRTMIHGHTHRPQRHSLTVDGTVCTRLVLADWRDTGEYLAWSADGIVPGQLG